MKKGFCIACACLFYSQISLSAEHALALDDAPPQMYTNPYASFALGSSWLDSTLKTGQNSNELKIKYKTGFNVAVAAGFKSKAMRYQLEYLSLTHQHKKFKLDGVQVSEAGGTHLKSLLFGFSYLFSHEVEFVQPYISGATGYAYIDSSSIKTVNAKFISNDTTDRKFVWYGAAGINFNIEPRWDLLLEYRHVRTQKAENALGDHYKAELVLLGMIYNF